jgi:DNA-binding beta-propeller fold protein YncE
MRSSLVCIFALFSIAAWGDEFSDVSGGFGVTRTLIGTHQTTTNDPNGFAIDFWMPSFEGAPATAAALSNPHVAQADAFGNVYIADKASHSILQITTDGNIHTYAGTHTAGFNGDGPASATSLMLNNANGLFVFPNGTLYVVDPGNHRIRRIDPTGTMTTIVNDPEPNWYPSGRGVWVSNDEQIIYYTNEFAPVPPSIIADGAVVKRWTPSGGIEVICSKDVGFRNPANLAVNPVDGKLYVCDRAEDDTTKIATGLWRIDGIDQRTRMTGNVTQPTANDGQLALNSFIDQPRGIAFLPNGAYFLCGHKDGNVWYVDTAGIIHRYLRGRGSKDYYNLTDGLHPPLTDLAPNGQEWFSQPRAVTLAPNGNLLVVCNDSGFVFQVNNVNTPDLPNDLRPVLRDSNGLHLRWSGLFGRGYIVQRTWSLLPLDWQVIGAAPGTPSDVPSEFIDPAATGAPRAFYRLAPSL